jgi:ribonuclease T1
MPRGVMTLWLILLGLMFGLQDAQAGLFSFNDKTPVILVANLPLEARDTLRLIKQGGPFPYSRDGIVFSNREHQLPNQPRGYYHEYTVKTPNSHNRGARRIVCGFVTICYYTDDHYQSFKRIQE